MPIQRRITWMEAYIVSFRTAARRRLPRIIKTGAVFHKSHYLSAMCFRMDSKFERIVIHNMLSPIVLLQYMDTGKAKGTLKNSRLAAREIQKDNIKIPLNLLKSVN